MKWNTLGIRIDSSDGYHVIKDGSPTLSFSLLNLVVPTFCCCKNDQNFRYLNTRKFDSFIILNLKYVGTWDNLGEVDESVNFVVNREFLLSVTIFMLPGRDIHEVFCTEFYQFLPDPACVIGQFCARIKVCDVELTCSAKFAYFRVE